MRLLYILSLLLLGGVSAAQSVECMDSTACNFHPEGTSLEGCIYPILGDDCTAGVILCAHPDYWDIENQTCSSTTCEGCPMDLNGDDEVNVSDLLDFLSFFGTSCDGSEFTVDSDPFEGSSPVDFNQIPDYVPQDSLFAWYGLDGGEAVNAMNPNDVGVFVNSPTPAVGRNGLDSTAMTFPGSSRIAFDWSIDSIQAFSISAWVKFESPSFQYAFGFGIKQQNNQGRGFGRSSLNGGPCGLPPNSLFIYDGGDGCNERVQTTCQFAPNFWRHVVIAHDTSSTRLFIDGVLLAEENDFVVERLHDFKLGTRSDNFTWFNGILDDVGVWTRALSESEIQSIYQGGAVPSGCTDDQASNYSLFATIDDGSCHVNGCVDPDACNVFITATCPDSTLCTYPVLGGDCQTGSSACGNGTSWNAASQTCESQNCPQCETDFNGDGTTGIPDLLLLLDGYESSCTMAE